MDEYKFELIGKVMTLGMLEEEEYSILRIRH